MGSPRLPDGIRRALVVGLGRSGTAAVEALARAGAEVVVTDERADADGADRARAAGASVRLGADPVPLLAAADVLVPSPGVPAHHPVVRAALDDDVPVWSEPELGWRLHGPRSVVGVTGTNGKTSTTELVTSMLRAGGVTASSCGNIGPTYTEVAGAADPAGVLVAELSSFQLRFCHQLRPHVAVLLNVAPDHLDWHGDIDAYAAAKARLWRAQKDGDWVVVNADDAPARRLAEDVPAGLALVSTGPIAREEEPVVGVSVEHGRLVSTVPGHRGELVAVDDIAPLGAHHVGNVAAAACAALLAGAGRQGVAEAARAFRPGPHRLEAVADVDGVRWVDDSKATNPHAAGAALDAFGPVVWIAGGIAKGVDVGPLAAHLSEVRHAVLLGESAGALAEVCTRAQVPWTPVESIEEAVALAGDLAVRGDVVLLAPACASFDQFRDYAERGERFAAAVRARSGAAP